MPLATSGSHHGCAGHDGKTQYGSKHNDAATSLRSQPSTSLRSSATCSAVVIYILKSSLSFCGSRGCRWQGPGVTAMMVKRRGGEDHAVTKLWLWLWKRAVTFLERKTTILCGLWRLLLIS